jgi:hypothetical protein
MQSTFKILLALAASCTVHASANVADCGSTMPASSANESTLSDPNLLSDLLHAPTAIDRARRLLVNGDSLRTGDDLSKRIVFDFNGAQPAAGATGSASKAAVNTLIISEFVPITNNMNTGNHYLPILCWS